MELNTDVVIIGSGPAAYTAALFLKSQELIMFEGDYNQEIGPGGQLTTTTAVDNYPGFPKGTNGPELMQQMKKQAQNNDLRILTEYVTKVKDQGKYFIVISEKYTVKCKAIIVSTGASAKKLEVPNSKKYWTKGISACAVCDGFFFMNKICVVIGGGDTALEEALFLSNICSRVIIIHRRDVFRARADKVEKARNTKNIEIKTFCVLKKCEGDKNALKSVQIEHTKSGQIEQIKTDGLFFAIGHKPNTQFLTDENHQNLVKIEENGYIIANEQMETSRKGIFACGDVQDFKYRQAVTAAASGCLAAKNCIKFLQSNYK